MNEGITRRAFVSSAALGAAIAAGAVGAGAARAGTAVGRSAAAADGRSRRAQRSAPSAGPDTSLLPELQVPVVPRSAWGARPPQAKMQRHRPRRLTLHHSGVFLGDNSLAPARMRQHQNWHMDNPDNNFPDIAYHFVVDRAGTVYEGRDWRYRGDTATEYDPTGHFLVCCEGDFNSQQPTREQLAAAVALFAWASQKWDIRPRRLAGHADYATTTCPGANLERLLGNGSLRRKVRRLNRRARVFLVPGPRNSRG